MIGSKELGFKMAENQEEAIWYQTQEDIKAGIQMLNSRIKNAQRDLKMTDREIAKRFRIGAKSVIQQATETIKVQEEVLKFVETKIKPSSNA